MSGDNLFDAIFGPRKRQRKSKWTATYIGPMTALNLTVLTSIVEEHKHSVQIETKPSQGYANYITLYDVTLFSLKDSEHKVKWILHLFEKNKKALKEAQAKAMEYVLNTPRDTTPSDHPENHYDGPEPLLAWHPIKYEPRPSVDPQQGTGTIPSNVRLPLSTMMRLAMGDNDPLIF